MSKTVKEKDFEATLIDTGENGEENNIFMDDQGWTRHEPGTRTRKKHTKPTETNDNRYQVVNLRTFQKFQERIYHVVHSIAHKPTNSTNKFCIEWIKAEKHASHSFDEKATFRTVQKLFKLKKLNEYRRLLLDCPDIGKYLTTRERDQDGISEFDYLFHQTKPATISVVKTAHLEPEIPIFPTKDASNVEKILFADSVTSTVTNKDTSNDSDKGKTTNPTYAEIAMSELNKKPSATQIVSTDNPSALITKPSAIHTLAVDTNVDSEGYLSCLGTTEDFGDLMHKVWLIMNS
mmetsp:Transcript_28356/g.40616  ORF Transcript_28356/g.40616 Transcript_28356/m.40616 type:complete len:291 (+) Transcript_28356:74-946(+)